MTNAIKAGIIAVANALMGVGMAFDAPLTVPQYGALLILLNSVLGLATVLTYKNSPRRIPDGVELIPGPSGPSVLTVTPRANPFHYEK